VKGRIIKFGSDTKHRKQWFTGISFSHPAKMMLPLQRWLIERYSKPGDVILDPMAGQGTLLIACTTGRNVITVELEAKFVQMQNDNWTKIQTLGPEMGYSMGTATILQGDARRLPDVLADVVITSPPYASQWGVSDNNRPKATFDREQRHKERHPDKYRPPLVAYSESMDNIGNLPYGKLADVIMTSPPYAETLQRWGNSETETMKKKGLHQESKDGIGSFPYGNIDCVITSPPYEDSLSEPEDRKHSIDQSKWGDGRKIAPPHSQVHLTYPSSSPNNIGNLKGESYLSAMLEVYQGCWRVLKPQGLMILVTKNFIRNKQEIRLDLDTIKLCEQAGFTFQDRWYRELASQSFWRTIYHQKYPDVEPIKYEDILVFTKALNKGVKTNG